MNIVHLSFVCVSLTSYIVTLAALYCWKRKNQNKSLQNQNGNNRTIQSQDKSTSCFQNGNESTSNNDQNQGQPILKRQTSLPSYQNQNKPNIFQRQTSLDELRKSNELVQIGENKPLLNDENSSDEDKE